MKQHEVVVLIRDFIKEHGLARPLMYKRETERGWEAVLTLPTASVDNAMEICSAWAQALDGEVGYGELVTFGSSEIQQFVTFGAIGDVLVTLVAVGAFDRIVERRRPKVRVAA